MNFKLKVLMAAMALAVAGQASATIDLPDAANGGLFVDAYDSAAGISFTGDLGAPTTVLNSAYTPSDPHYNDFTVAATSAAGTTYVWDLTAFSAWSSFKAAASAANAVFDVLGGTRTSPGLSIGNNGLLTTSNTALTTIKNITNSGLQGIITKLDTQFLGGTSGVNAMAGQSVANGSSTAVSTDVNAYIGNAKGTNLFASSTASMSSVANSQSFYQLATSGSSSLGKITATAYTGSWFLDYAANTLTYSVAAVPEADTWAMMVAGLGLMGFIARRRMSA